MEFLAKLTESRQVILEMLKKFKNTPKFEKIDQSRPLISKTHLNLCFKCIKNALTIITP